MWIKNWFSNILPFDVPMEFKGILFKTPENFYQAMKLDINENLKGIKEIAAMNPYAAKKAIRDKVKYPWGEHWNKEMSLDVMELALRWKFAPNTTWSKKLLETGTEEIVEWNNWNDKFWGKDIKSKEGENHLGKILMKIRDELNK